MDNLLRCIPKRNIYVIQMLPVFMALMLVSCNSHTGSSPSTDTAVVTPVNPYNRISAIPLPEGFRRNGTDSSPFASYLRNMPLKSQTTVYLFNGQPKHNQEAQFALLDISTGSKDLQQCADAVMRLRAEYLFEHGKFEQIIFFDNNRDAYRFTPPYTRSRFDHYLTRVFGMCGSASLAKQLKPVNNFYNMQPGDVLIRGGFPGHAAIVMDVAVNPAGKKIYLLAQSYMPAQDIHVLKNPANADLSPWYEVNEDEIIRTPEYTFKRGELMRW